MKKNTSSDSAQPGGPHMGVKLKPLEVKTVYELLVGWGAKKRNGQRNDETSKKARGK
jgi:hypothetical protein